MSDTDATQEQRDVAADVDEIIEHVINANMLNMPYDVYSELFDAVDGLGVEIENLQSENAKLRELVGLWSVINKHMSLCATTDCGQCPVREECAESVYLEGLLGIDLKGLSWRVQERMAETTDVQAENAKLRELTKEMFYSLLNVAGGRRTMTAGEAQNIMGRMRELGVDG